MFDFYTIKLQINFHSYVFFLNFLYRTHVIYQDVLTKKGKQKKNKKNQIIGTACVNRRSEVFSEC